MVTGDAPATAAIVAHEVGLTGPVCPPGKLPEGIKPEDFAVFASILPEGKFDLVKAFQKSGHTVGMCGDGANDAPALRQAQIGIAVSTATDVAKSAAGVVLTEAGLGGIVAAVKIGQDHVSAHSHLHAELSDEEDPTGVPACSRLGDNRPRGPHSHVDGHSDD